MHRGSYTLLMRFVVLAVFYLLSSLCLPAQSRRNNRAVSTPTQPSIIDIRQVDFRNFAYVLGGKTYKLRDGFYAENVAAGGRWELRMVDGPFYGDLTGDGKDEVAFVLSHGPEQAANAAEARVYTLRQGRAVLLATLVVKEAVNCELDHYIRINDGMIITERVYGNQGRCDHNELTEYRWNGAGFVPMGASARVPCRCM